MYAYGGICEGHCIKYYMEVGNEGKEQEKSRRGQARHSQHTFHSYFGVVSSYTTACAWTMYTISVQKEKILDLLNASSSSLLAPAFASWRGSLHSMA